LRNGDSVELGVPAGEHQLWIVGWGRSALTDAVTFQLDPGQTAAFACRAVPESVFRRSLRRVALDRSA
jgi:hypothetical protein